MFLLFCFFFFSSRRRHTRFDCDWSSDVCSSDLKKAQGKTVLDPLAYPPTVFSIEMLAFMPAVQRERAGFLERLASYFSSPTSRRSFFILAGKKVFRPLFELLRDPLHADAQGRVSAGACA